MAAVPFDPSEPPNGCWQPRHQNKPAEQPAARLDLPVRPPALQVGLASLMGSQLASSSNKESQDFDRARGAQVHAHAYGNHCSYHLVLLVFYQALSHAR
jgi:hypothetical protein